jgi:hypothetical protein
VPLLILTIGTLPLLLLETIRTELPYPNRLFLDVANVVVLVAFAADDVVELRPTAERRAFLRSEWSSLLIVVSQVVALIRGLGGVGALRVLRGGPALRAGVPSAGRWASSRWSSASGPLP